jgi:adenylate kinase
MLRAAVAAGTETGLKAKEAMQTGALVTDDLVVAVVVDRLAEPDCENGCVLDGFPRTTAQATALDDALARVNGQKVTKVMALECPDAALAKRVCGRWVHAESGRSYHVDFKKPKSLPLDGAVATRETMRDDETGEALTKRADDTEEALATRLSAYHAQSAPVLAHYHTTGCVARVDGNQTQERVWEAIEDALAA